MSLLIDQAVEPANCSATPSSGGSLAASTTYYYRVAIVTEKGETCACDAFSGTTTDVKKTLDLAWDAVAGVKATGGYKIYRNTSDSWSSSNLLIKTVDTNSWTDDGTETLTDDQPMTLTLEKVMALPVGENSIIPDVPTIGTEGGEPTYLGSHSQRIRLEGFFFGSTAKTKLDQLRAIRVGGIACRMTFTVFSEVWVQSNYLIANLSWWPEPSTPDHIDTAVLKFILELIEST